MCIRCTTSPPRSLIGEKAFESSGVWYKSNYKIPGLDCNALHWSDSFVRSKLWQLKFAVSCTYILTKEFAPKNYHKEKWFFDLVS